MATIDVMISEEEIAKTVEELANQIEENKRIDYDSLFKKYHTFYDGKSSSKIANLIYSLVEAIKWVN